jgi:hypothetical protein
MYGAVRAMSRSVGVLKAPGALGAPGSCSRHPERVEVVVREQRPAVAADAAALALEQLPTPCTAADIVPRSKLVVGGSRLSKYAVRAAARSGFRSSSLMWLTIVPATNSSTESDLPVQP